MLVIDEFIVDRVQEIMDLGRCEVERSERCPRARLSPLSYGSRFEGSEFVYLCSVI
jgi:hypothetical protein